MKKKQVLYVFVLLLSMTVLHAVDSYAQRTRMSLDDRMKSLTEKLSLTKVQADSIRAIYTIADKERSDAFQAHNDDRAAMREEMQKIIDATDKKIEALLTDDQKKKYDEIKKDRPMMRGGQSRRRSDG